VYEKESRQEIYGAGFFYYYIEKRRGWRAGEKASRDLLLHVEVRAGRREKGNWIVESKKLRNLKQLSGPSTQKNIREALEYEKNVCRAADS